MYYLQSRYYDPETGRFINADALASTGQGLLGNNMFAYCLNNPVALVDSNGMCSYMSSLSGWVDCGDWRCPNSSIPSAEDQTSGLINGQSTLPYADQSIGLGSYGHSGCPYIAVYNALQLLGQGKALSDITNDLFPKSLFFGAGGVSPWSIAGYFDEIGVNYAGYYKIENLTQDISEGSIIVFTVILSSGWHVMTAQYRDGKYCVYNQYNKSDKAYNYDSLNGACKNSLFLYGIRIDP